MAYSTQTDLSNAVGEPVLIKLTNDTGGKSVDTDVLSAIIADVDDEIDSYLRNRYTLPLTRSTPGMINRIAVAMGVYYLYTRRPNIAGLPQMVKDNHDKVMGQLQKISSGHINPNITEPGDDRIFVTNKASTDRKFTTTELNKY